MHLFLELSPSSDTSELSPLSRNFCCWNINGMYLGDVGLGVRKPSTAGVGLGGSGSAAACRWQSWLCCRDKE